MIIKKYFMKSVNRITKDFKQKELLPLKLVFFVQASTISVLYPYLTIHMRELGINVEEAAIMSAVIPVIGILMPPLAGMVADKIGNFKLLLAFFSLIGGGAALLLLLVPVGRATVTYPDKVTLSFGCGGLSAEDLHRGHFQVALSSDIPCDQVPRSNGSDPIAFDLNAMLEGCGFVCSSSQEFVPEGEFLSEENMKSPTDPILKGRSYTIQIPTETGTKSYRYNLTKEEVPITKTKEDILSNRVMANDDYLKKSIRRVTPSEYFFPASGLSHLKCQKVPTEGEERIICVVGAPEEMVPVENGSIKFRLQAGDEEVGLGQFHSDYITWNTNESLPVTCVNSELEGKEDISAVVFLHNPENNLEVMDTISLSECKPRCLLSAARKDMCSNLKKEIEYDPQLTFWTYLVIRVFIGIIGSTSYAMYEVAVIAILREQKADYGLQRIYASIGGMISSPLSGILIDYASQGKGYTDFKPAFYLYAGLKAGTSILMLFINLEFKKAASNVVSDAIRVLKNLEIIALLFVCFVFGTAWGYIESFLFWFLEDLGGTRSLMGITITVGGIAGIPLLVLSGPIIDKIGHANVLFIGFIFYGIRLVGYSLIYNPYHCLYFEAMESITSSLAITAAITYAAKLSTTTTDGSIQGLVGGLYFGVGRGAGSLIGGYLMKAFGTRETYRIFSVFSVITGIAYWLFNQFYIKKRPQVEGNEICKKEPKVKKTEEPELKIITEKPKVEVPENNNTEKEPEKMAKDNEAFEDTEEDIKVAKKEEPQENPGNVPDKDTNAQNEQEMKKKED